MIGRVRVTAIEPVTLKARVPVQPPATMMHSSRGEPALLAALRGWDDKLGRVGGIGGASRAAREMEQRAAPESVYFT